MREQLIHNPTTEKQDAQPVDAPRTSSVHRVIDAGSKETEEWHLGNRPAIMFEDQSYNERATKFERQKTPEEIELINLANEVSNNILRHYGFPEFNIPPANVHVIPADNWSNFTGRKPKLGEIGGGKYSIFEQSISIREGGKMLSYHNILHELIHFKSYGSMRAVLTFDPENDQYTTKLGSHRVGFENISREGKIFFTALNEAFTEELAVRNLLTFKRIARAPLITSIKLGLAKTLSYPQERRGLTLLIKKLYMRNREFKNEQEVFDVFAKGFFSGDFARIGKLIEQSLGTGALKRIASSGMGYDFLKTIMEL